MIATIIWRFKEAIAVFTGKKKTQRVLPVHQYSETSIENIQQCEITDEKVKNFIENLEIEFVFSEFKEERVNAGGAKLSQKNRLDPSLSTLRKYFPNAKYTVYSDFDLEIPDVKLVKVETPVLQKFKEHPRHFYHLADYYKFMGMLNSDADVSVAIDSDMFVWSENIYRLIYLTKCFGYCVPGSSGRSMNFEIATSLDTVPITDESGGFGTTVNITPMTLSKDSENGRKYFETCCEILEQEPSRASIVMWKAAWKTALYPYILPKEFCVVQGSEGIGNEVLLHVGHPSVAKYYNVKL